MQLVVQVTEARNCYHPHFSVTYPDQDFIMLIKKNIKCSYITSAAHAIHIYAILRQTQVINMWVSSNAAIIPVLKMRRAYTIIIGRYTSRS